MLVRASRADKQVTLSPVTTNCTITAVLGDGTTQSIHVTIGPDHGTDCQVGVVAIDNGPDFTSLTCEPPLPHFGDAATE